ncbi:hypothetical protein SSP24_20850 [Streptomyces spinoverrucosus]|uniref:Uncharacterized protein n=1 Tax=Streptomyces spinoverrucosus TaxID=284043 RepID=A0A4Y3VF50_9ACTN|nr:hypothetical protein [Streptomyces spinoverrucosus]GEC04430.1 hypothetical protein SSP24_20850 [Streptomyces spinoverrucosus]GHB56975.1 hypothetical protein GCM10010397_29090 [Streptomyces spinoverrucosus]
MSRDVPFDSSRDPDALAALLPRWHRLRDAEEGEPLRALLAVVTEQLDRVRDGVAQGYEDLFVETAAPWVLPYLGDLVGYRTLPGYERVLTTGLHDGGRSALAEAVAPRADVAATVANRRRKGTLHLLEELSERVADWPARAVELSRLVAHTQPVKLYGGTGAHRAERGRLADLRDGAALDLAGGPFGATARTVDVRRADSGRRQGGWTPAGVALFVWRLKAHALTSSPAYCIDRARNLYTFSILGNDTPLVTKPFPEPSPTHIATIDNVPAFIRRRQLHDRLLDYYGPGKSFVIRRDGEDQPVPPSDIVVADLSDWRYRPKRGQVAVDPELGRIAFGSRTAPRQGVWVDYHYAFAADMGGGEYARDDRVPRPDATFYRVGPGQPYRQIMDAYRAWQHDRRADRTGPEGIIEITHSGAYQEQLDFDLDPGDRLELRAAEGTRPVVRLLDWYSNRPDALNIRAVSEDCAPHERPRVVLDGLLVAGRGINVTGPMGAVVVRHSTLVPGWSLEPECDPHSPEEPSIVLDRTTACLQVEHSILGTIEVIGDEVTEEPLDIHLRDSVLDATADDREALSAPDCRHAHAVLHLHRTTVIGEIHTHAVRIAENSIFTGRLHVARRGIGCLRFSYVPTGSRTPRRYRCQPDLSGGVRPLFVSQRYGTPWYGLLADGCPEEVRRGADDGAEMGAFHDLYRPQREDGLRARLAEYTPAGTDAGIFFVT